MHDPTGPPELARLRALVGQRHVLEILDALSDGPVTTAGLAVAVPGARRRLPDTLRILAADALITTDDTGSWDERVAATREVRLSERGRHTVRLLCSSAVWAALYEQTNPVLDR
jgi:DNA-binding HxlR family transcriptional regulator